MNKPSAQPKCKPGISLSDRAERFADARGMPRAEIRGTSCVRASVRFRHDLWLYLSRFSRFAEIASEFEFKRQTVYGGIRAARDRARSDKLSRPAEKTKRACLTCDEAFESEGPHNRMCGKCRQKSFYDGRC